MIAEKGSNLAQSYDKSPFIQRIIQKAPWQHKTATKNFDYTTIAEATTGTELPSDSNHKSNTTQRTETVNYTKDLFLLKEI